MLCRVSMYRIVATLLYIPSDLDWNVLEPYTSEAATMWHSRHRHDMTFHTMPQCSFRFRYNVGDILCNRCSMQTPSSKILFLSRRGQIWVSAKHDPRWKFPNNWLICVAPPNIQSPPKNRGYVCSWCNGATHFYRIVTGSAFLSFWAFLWGRDGTHRVSSVSSHLSLENFSTGLPMVSEFLQCSTGALCRRS